MDTVTHGTTERTVNVGVLGCGNVGAALVQLIRERGDEIAARTGLRLTGRPGGGAVAVQGT